MDHAMEWLHKREMFRCNWYINWKTWKPWEPLNLRFPVGRERSHIHRLLFNRISSMLRTIFILLIRLFRILFFLLLCLINSFFGTFEKTQLQIEHFLEHLAKWHCFFPNFNITRRLTVLFQCLTGLSCYIDNGLKKYIEDVSMPSRAWVVTASEERR